MCITFQFCFIELLHKDRFKFIGKYRNVTGSDISQNLKELPVLDVDDKMSCQSLCTRVAQDKCSQCVGYRYNKTCTIIQRATKTQQHLTPIGGFNMLHYLKPYGYNYSAVYQEIG